MHELILQINSYSIKIAIATFLVMVIILFLKRFGKKDWNELLSKVIKPVIYILIAAFFIHIIFSIRLAM
jgi:chromate transport protein ChrA